MGAQNLLEESGFTVYWFNRKNRLSAVRDNFNLKSCENLFSVKDVDRFSARTGYKLG